uniref:Ovule protein n=1 Tax=Caenorhabditis tropicalis TaxID=1561998 RepID=A0A1I7UPQ7_9PELO
MQRFLFNPEGKEELPQWVDSRCQNPSTFYSRVLSWDRNKTNWMRLDDGTKAEWKMMWVAVGIVQFEQNRRRFIQIPRKIK